MADINTVGLAGDTVSRNKRRARRLTQVGIGACAVGVVAALAAIFPDAAPRIGIAAAAMAPSLVAAWWATAKESRVGDTLAAMLAAAGVLALAAVVNEVSVVAGIAAIVAGAALFGWLWLHRRDQRRRERAPVESPGPTPAEPSPMTGPADATVVKRPAPEPEPTASEVSRPSTPLLATRLKGQREAGSAGPDVPGRASESQQGPGRARWVQLQSNRTRPRQE